MHLELEPLVSTLLIRFLDPPIWWYATGSGWNLRQPTWAKPNDVKSLQSWASRMCWANGRWGQSTKLVGAIPKVWDNEENILQQIVCCESLSRHLLNLKVLVPSKALKLYTTLSLTSTTNCFAPMFKRKLSNICMMNCNDRLRCFNETLTNWHWMSNVTNSCICEKWFYMTCSNNKMRTLIFVKKIVHWSGKLV